MTDNVLVVYSETFAVPVGSRFPEWTAIGYSYSGNGMEGRGMLPVTNVAAPNGERFLGEFGGPKIVAGPPFVEVTDGVILTLDRLPSHSSLTLAFDLLICPGVRRLSVADKGGTAHAIDRPPSGKAVGAASP